MKSRLQLFICLLTIICRNGCHGNIHVSKVTADTIPVHGGNITLGCSYSPMVIDRVEWQDGNGSVLASLNCKKGPCRENVPMSHKFDLVVNDSTMNLTIKDLTSEDSGNYQCSVQTKDGDGFASTTVEVLEQAPPNRVSIFGGHFLTTTAGEETTVTCISRGARPPATLNWIIPDTLQASLGKQINVARGGSYVSLWSAIVTPSRGDHGVSLHCQVSHPELQRVLEAEVRLDVQAPPTSLQIYTPSGLIIEDGNGTQKVIVFQNTLTSINCKSSGSRPEAYVSWTLGTADNSVNTTSSVTHNPDDASLYDTEETLQILPERRHHNQTFRCLESFRTSRRYIEVLLLVYETPDPPEISILYNLEDGVRTRLVCTSDNGYPSPMIHWYIGSKNVTFLSRTLTIPGDYERAYVRSSLEFTPSKADHGTILTCRTVQMTSGSTLSMQSQNTSMVLDVLYNPVILELSFLQFVTDVTFSCRVDANPSASQFTWLHNGSSLNNTTENTQIRTNYLEEHTDSSSELTIRGVSPDDQGEYKCVTSTGRGDDSSVINYTFAFTPDAPSNLEVYRQQTTSSSITLAWQPGFYGGFQQTFNLQYCTHGTPQPLDQECDLATHITGTNHTLTSLKPYTWYEITLWAANVAGNSSSRTVMASTAHTTGLNEPSFQSRTIPLVPISLGVIASACFILLITLGVMYYNGVLCCLKRKKGIFSPAAKPGFGA